MFEQTGLSYTQPGKRARRRKAPHGRTSILAALFAVLLCSACQHKIVRIPVPPENLMKANLVARDGDVAFARKDYYAALIKYLEATRLNPNSEHIYNKLGIAYSQLKFYTEAASAFQHSVYLNPKYAYAHNNLGTVYFASDEKRKAEKAFKKAISLASGVASFHVNLGSLYFERRKYDKGMQEWRKALTLDPKIMGRSDSISLQATSQKSTNKSYFMARLFASMGDVEKAVANLEQAIAGGFSDVEAIRTERDFDAIREDQRFIALLKTASLLNKE